MTFLIRWICTMDDGEVVQDETVPADLTSLWALEKGMTILGRRAVLRVEFDPPLEPISLEREARRLAR